MGLRRRHTEVDLDAVFTTAQMEIQNGCSGAENLRRTLKMKYHMNITRSISREIVKFLDAEGVKRRKQRRLRRRQYFSKGPNFVWHLDGYDKLKPYGISIHGCIDGFSRRVIWLEADVTNKRPEVIAEYYLDAIQNLNGIPQKIRADPGTENGIIATFHAFMKRDNNAVTLGSSTSNQRIERFWGLLRQMKADFWIHHFKGLMFDDLLRPGDPLHILCVQYVYLPMLKRDIKDVMDHWNNHSIRKQNLGDTIHGIPETLFRNPEIVGSSDYLQVVDRNVVLHLKRLITNDFKDIDNHFVEVASSILYYNDLPQPDNISDWNTARHLYIFLSNCISQLVNPL
nr:uncharacterized protein LOC111100282 isoform X2 [Crassostrea virginica]